MTRVYEFTDVLERYYTGAGIPHFTGRSLAKMLFPLPPTVEQNRIVAKVDQLMALCDDLEAKLNKSEAAACDLLNSMVHHLLNGA